ncbi:MAG: Fic family protein [Bacteroidetes bacterium]|nr:Fic family protein [Bacteroidota bacterium]
MKNFKAGIFTKQHGYKGFKPNSIQYPFEWESDIIIKLLSEANLMLGELNVYSELVPDVNFFIEMHKVKEATNSTRIEGTQTGIDEAVLKKASLAPEKRDDWQEVRNYIDALNYTIERLDKLPLSMRLLKEAHEILLSGVRGEHKMPGEVRTSQNWIGGASIESAVFVPPHPSELPELLSNLEFFWHDEKIIIPELIRIAISHYQFETIHPFLDGNGRIGRLLITLQLLHYGLLKKPVLYLSAFFEQHRGGYTDSLLRVSTSNDLDQWLRFFLTGIIRIAKEGEETFSNIGKLREKYHEAILELGKRSKLANQLLQHLYANPIISPRDVEQILEITPATANRLLKEMEKIGMLKERTGFSRNRLYELHEYLGLFQRK